MKKIIHNFISGYKLLILLVTLASFTVLLLVIGGISGDSKILIKKRTAKKAALLIDKNKDGGLGGAYKPDVVSSPVSFFTYYIRSGESIGSIAGKLGMDEVTLVNVNDIKYPSLVKPGMELRIPSQDGLLVKAKNDSELAAVAKKYNFEKEEILRLNNLELADLSVKKEVFLPGIKVDSVTRSLILGEYFIRPAYGRFTSYFGGRRDPWTGRRSFHQGVDIANRGGGNIYASAPGTVISTGWSWIYGNYIKIKHTSGYVTFYGHLDRINVSNSQWVQAGSVIGRMGNTGRSTGLHLHFEIRQYGRAINPFKVTVF